MVCAINDKMGINENLEPKTLSKVLNRLKKYWYPITFMFFCYFGFGMY